MGVFYGNDWRAEFESERSRFHLNENLKHYTAVRGIRKKRDAHDMISS